MPASELRAFCFREDLLLLRRGLAATLVAGARSARRRAVWRWRTMLMHIREECGQLSFIEDTVFVRVKAREDVFCCGRLSHAGTLAWTAPTALARAGRRRKLAISHVLVESSAFRFVELAVFVHVILVEQVLRDAARAPRTAHAGTRSTGTTTAHTSGWPDFSVFNISAQGGELSLVELSIVVDVV